MIDNLREKLSPFRAKAVEEGEPAEEVDRWIDQAARPCAFLTDQGDGPVVGRFGGPLLLPAGVPTPDRPYIASVDLAALPKDATDLHLPPDGTLLLFADLTNWGVDTDDRGPAIYVPAGTPVEERDRNAWHSAGNIEDDQRISESLPQCDLRVRTEPDLPHYGWVRLPDGKVEPLPYAGILAEVWGYTAWDRLGISQWSPLLQIGGYPDHECAETDPMTTVASNAAFEAEEGHWGGGEPVSGAVEDWVLLASWTSFHKPDGMTVHWGIQRADLAARRFDRTFATLEWNP